jgi:putative MATE family efflux protein
MQIQLSEKFTYKKLIRFTMPSIIMMIFTSIYGVVDGVFVSNFVGKTPFAAINLFYPVYMVIAAVGFMIGTGGSALVSKLMGEGDRKKANETFSLLIYFSFVLSAVLSGIVLLFLEPICVKLGAEGELLDSCLLYGRILLPFMPVFVLQNECQSFLVAAERPKLGLWVTVAAGCTNILFDALLVAVFPLGLAGAAMATALSQVVGGVIPFIYFLRSKSGLLKLGKARFRGREILAACANGSSEMMANISVSIVNILYNFRLMEIAGEDGLAAYGVIMYVNFIFMAIFFGYSVGSSPVISYHYGAGNTDEIKSLKTKSLVLVAVAAGVMTMLAEVLAYPLAKLFVGYDEALFKMTARGFMLYSLSYLVMGFNVFGSSFFTALNNGGVSAIISFARTFFFQMLAVWFLPMAIGLDGIWLAVVAAELASILVTVFFFALMKSRYKY